MDTTPRSVRLFDSLLKQDLIPAGGVVATDPPLTVETTKTQPSVRPTVKSSYRPRVPDYLEVAVKKAAVEPKAFSLDLAPIAERPKIKIPRMHRCNAYEVVRNKIMPSGFYLSFTGSRGEIWCDDNRRHIAIVDRSGKIQLFGKDTYQVVLNYIVDIQSKGINTVQSVDIICSQLGI